jgi:high-affinity nickel-transport protein
VISLSVAVALMIGTIELLQLAAGKLGFDEGFWSFIVSLDFGQIGYAVVALLGATSAGAAVLWKTAHLE